MLSVVAPFTAEEMWERLGHAPTVAAAGWPQADPALLVEDSVTCIVQVAGKVRAKLSVPPAIDEAQLRELALADERVQRSLGDRPVSRVIVRAPRLVNVVPG
jgi:leucyl-tRNA synthetase